MLGQAAVDWRIGACRAAVAEVLYKLVHLRSAGKPVPRGQAAVGWRIGVWWPHDRTFYVGDVTSYSGATGRSVMTSYHAKGCHHICTQM